MMNNAEIAEKLRLLQQEVTLAGDAVDDLKSTHRAEVDTLRLEVEVLRRCLLQVQPALADQFAELRAEVFSQVDPESIS